MNILFKFVQGEFQFSMPQRFKSLLLAHCILIPFLLSISIAQAVTQGTEGNTSTGTVEINVSIGRVVRIAGLRDFNFGAWSTGDGTLSDNDNVCIGKNDFFGPYAIRASGDGDLLDPSAFTLSNGADQIRYNVFWNDVNGVTGNQQLSPGLILRGQTGTSAFVFFLNAIGFCINNANLQVEIPQTELDAASGGSYSGTLTLLIIPD